MCSELFRIPITWHGVPIFGFGLVLIAWLGVGAWAVVSTAKETGWPASLKAHLPTVAVVAVLLAVVIPKYVPRGVPVRSYGLLVLIGIVAGIALSIHRAVQSGLEVDDMLGMALWVIPGGAIGGRLFYVVQYWNDRIREPDLWGTIKNALAFTEGGLVVYGAFAGAMAAFFVYVWRNKLPALTIADIVAPGMMVGLAFGRIGCLMNGCCYGGEAHIPWAITFPRENAPSTTSPPYAEQASVGRFYGFQIGESPRDRRVVVIERVDQGSLADNAGVRVGDVVTGINGHSMGSIGEAHVALFDAVRDGKAVTLTTPKGVRQIAAIEAPARSLPVHPAQIYSSIDAALLAWVLWSYYPYRRREGEVMALMIMVHPISRFLLEAIRIDESPVWGTGLSISQNLSVLLFLVGLGMWFYLPRKSREPLAIQRSAGAQHEPRLAGIR